MLALTIVMIPYTTCMRFNRSLQRQRHVIVVDGDERSHPNQWTLVPHSNQNIEPSIINIDSQDDQTLCFTWILDTHTVSGADNDNSTLTPHSTHTSHDDHRHDESQSRATVADVHESDENTGYLLLTLRRRKSIQRSIHIDPISLLDDSYYGITKRFMKQSSKWHFNTFTLDVLTGGHSLSHLLFYLFTEYKFIETFKLDVVNVWRCFRFLEAGYHDTNPYHNSVHAADVTQAMHCFIQESKIRDHLTPMEAMCSLLAAVSHDLDHPGVNQHFLIATKSHLAALYKNFSVLESHHWRFAISCFHESQIFTHLSPNEWNEIETLLKSLILATDITRQADYISTFKTYLSSDLFSMSNAEHRHFILQIALKCADLGNPCRPWTLSQKWSEQICSEFYRQGDYERQLKIVITPICDRYTSTIAAIQTDFFRNIVTPLFELWDQFLCSPLSKQLIANLRFNNQQWSSSFSKIKLKRRHSFNSLITAKQIDRFVRRSNSLNNVNDIKVELSLSEFRATHKPEEKKCQNGCGTPPNEEFNTLSQRKESKVLWDLDVEEEDEDEVEAEVLSNSVNFSQTYSIPSHASYFYEKKHQIGRRGSAPGCIGTYGTYTSCELAAAAALVFLHGAVASQDQRRRSSFPVDYVGAAINSANNIHNTQYTNGAKMNRSTAAIRGRSLELLVSLTKNKGLFPSTTNAQHHKFLRRQACSLDSSAESSSFHWFFNGKPRRGSVPQEILIESLSNYTS